MAEVTMPRLSDTMTEGTIARWLKQPGDQVQKGEILLEIETDKATMELEAYEAGVVEKVLVSEGETVPIGQPIMLIGDGSGASAESSQPAAAPAEAPAESPKTEAAATQAPTAPESPAEAPAEPQRSFGYGFPAGESALAPGGGGAATAAPAQAAPSPAANGEVRASPMARAIAREKGIDLSSVQGSGPAGRVIRADVERVAVGGAPAAAAAPPSPQPTAAAPSPQPAPSAAPAPAPASAQAGPDQEI
ncbi:MAG: biotin/lipoyl-containing protein, partial [Chloroflexota bacterium]